MNRLPATAQLLIVIAAIIVVAGLVVMLGIMPAFNAATAVDEQIAQAHVDLQAANALIERRQSAKSQSAGNQVELMRIANEIPDSPQLPNAIIELQDAANAAGLTFAQVTPGGIEPGVNADGTPAAYSSVAIQLIVRGDWKDVIDFTRRLQKFERAVRVRSVAVAHNAGDGLTGPYEEANYQIVVYVMAAAPEVAPAPASVPASPPADATPSQ